MPEDRPKQQSFTDAMTGFKLDEEHLKKLGLNADMTEMEGYVPPEKLDYDPRTNEMIEDSRDRAEKAEAEPEKKSETEVKPEDKPKDKEETPVSTTEQPESETKIDKKETTLPPTTETPIDDFTQKIIDAAKVYQTPDERNQLLSDIANREKFWATVTQKSQSVAAREKVFNDYIEVLGLPTIKEALENADLQEALDGYYKEDGKDNPFRKFPEILKSISDKEKKEQEDFDRELDRQIMQLKSFDKKYENFDEVLNLSKVADDYGVNLLKAYELQQSNLKSSTEINSLKSQIGEKDKNIEKLTNELKERNDELSEIRKSGTVNPVIKPGASGSPVKSETIDLKPSVGWDKKTNAIKKKLGIS